MARAILITQGGPIGAGVLAGMLQAGIEIAEIWGLRSGYRTTRRFAPGWDVTRLAERNRIGVFHNPRLRGWTGAAERIAERRADLLVTAMTLHIVPRTMLEIFGRRAVNFHPALLPEYRGPTPIPGMLLDGRADACGGLTIHQLTPGIDEGPLIAQRAVPRARLSYQAWLGRIAGAGHDLALNDLPRYLEGSLDGTAQTPGSYCNVKAQLDLGAHINLETARRLALLLGDTGRLTANRHRVRSLISVAGPPTGEPPRIDRRTVTLDLADVRARFQRVNAWHDLSDRLGMLRALRAIDRAQE
ncbi:MAG: formyltransferase family protein [Devosia sp.]